MDKDTYQLTTETNPFNVFARAGAGLMGEGNADDNAALERAGQDYAKRFTVWRTTRTGTRAASGSESPRCLHATGLMSGSNTRARV